MWGLLNLSPPFSKYHLPKAFKGTTSNMSENLPEATLHLIVANKQLYLLLLLFLAVFQSLFGCYLDDLLSKFLLNVVWYLAQKLQNFFRTKTVSRSKPATAFCVCIEARDYVQMTSKRKILKLYSIKQKKLSKEIDVNFD